MQQGTLSKLDWFITKHNRLIELKKRKRMKLKLSLKKKTNSQKKIFGVCLTFNILFTLYRSLAATCITNWRCIEIRHSRVMEPL